MNFLEHTNTVSGLALVDNQILTLVDMHRMHINWDVAPNRFFLWCSTEVLKIACFQSEAISEISVYAS